MLLFILKGSLFIYLFGVGGTSSYDQGLLLALHWKAWGPYEILGFRPGSASCKANALPAVLLLQPRFCLCVSEKCYLSFSTQPGVPFLLPVLAGHTFNCPLCCSVLHIPSRAAQRLSEAGWFFF